MHNKIKFLKKIIDKSNYSLIILTLICLAVIFIMVDKIEFPGSQADDSVEIVSSYKIIHNILQHDPPRTIVLLDRVFPINSYYNGHTHLYMFGIPMTLVFGLDLMNTRVYGILLVVLVTVFTYLSSKELFDSRIGLISAALFAFMPSTILFAKYPYMPAYALVFFAISSLYFFIKWKKSQKSIYLMLGFFVIGLGLSQKILFVWIVISLIVMFIIFRPKIQKKLKNILLATVSLISGTIVLIISWILNYQSFIYKLVKRSSTTSYGISNTDILSNLMQRFWDVKVLLNGQSVLWMSDTVHSNPIFYIFFIISLIGIMIMSIKETYRRKYAFLLLFLAVIIGSSIFTVSSLNATSLIIILPILAIIMGVFIVGFTDQLKKLPQGKIISLLTLFVILIPLIGFNFVVIDDYKNDLERTGGVRIYSIQISKVAEYLVENDYNKVMMLDWGFQNTIYLESNGKVEPKMNVLWDKDNQLHANTFKTRLVESFNIPETVYLKYEKDTLEGTSDLLHKILEEENKKIIILKTFRDWEDQDYVYIYKIV